MCENYPLRYKELLCAEFTTYQEFFNDAFSTIMNEEIPENVRDITNSLRSSVEKMSGYLGAYHGSLSSCVHRINNIRSAVIILAYVSLTAYVSLKSSL